MRTKEDLFELVHSLSKAERRGFKLYAGRYSSKDQQKKYVQLFDAVAAQDTYDEGQIKVKLEGVIPLSSFGSWKRHLLEYLEGFLREFYSGRDSVERVHELLREAELLHRRGLWQRSRRKVAECRQSAERMEDLLTLLKINETERRLVKEFDQKKLEARIRSLTEEWKEISRMWQEEQIYAELYDQASLLVRMHFDFRNLEVKRRAPELLQHVCLQGDVRPRTFKGKRYYHQARAFLFHLCNEREQEHDEYVLLLDVWNAHPQFIGSLPRSYKLALTNYLHVAVKLKRFDQFEAILEAVDNLPPENFEEAAEDFQTVEFYRLVWALNLGKFKEAAGMVAMIEAGMEKYGEKVNAARWMSFRINMGMAYFFLGEVNAALEQLEAIQRYRRTEHRLDLQALARVLEPVLLYERGEDRLLDSRLHALREWLRVHHRMFEFERTLISYLDQLREGVEKEEVLFQRFGEALVPFVGVVQGAEEVSYWVASKVEGVSLAEIVVREHRL